MTDLLRAVIILFAGTGALAFLSLTLKLAFGNKDEYNRNKRRSGSSVWAILTGRIPAAASAAA